MLAAELRQLRVVGAGDVFTAPDTTLPLVGTSSPPRILSRVDFAAARRPQQHDKFAAVELQINRRAMPALTRP